MLVLPEVLNSFNLYDDTEKLVGVTGEITLPEFEMINDTLDGAGILGEIEDPVTGQFGSATIGFKWSCINDSFVKMMNTTKPLTLTLRASLQCLNTDTGLTDYYPCKMVVRGKPKNINFGKAEKGKKMECETEIEVMYFKVVLDNKTVFELDKLNFKYVLNGTDMLAKIRRQIG